MATSHHRPIRSLGVLTCLAAALAVVIATLAMPPATADADEVPNVLVYSGTQAFRHGSIDYGNPIIQRLADDTGTFTVDFTEDPADLVASTLADYDILLFNSPSGPTASRGDSPAESCEMPQAGILRYARCDHAPFTEEQREGLLDWFSCGGGVVGIHQVMDAWHDWPEWDELTGMVFSSHYSNAEAELSVLSDHATAAPFGDGAGDTHIGDTFLHADEFYDWAPGNGPLDLSSDVVPLLGIREFTDTGVEGNQGDFYDHDQPLAWLSTFRGDNRVFMTNLGHNTTTWDNPAYQEHLVEGITHVAQQRPDADCVAGIPDPTLTWPGGNPYVYGL